MGDSTIAYTPHRTYYKLHLSLILIGLLSLRVPWLPKRDTVVDYCKGG